MRNFNNLWTTTLLRERRPEMEDKQVSKKRRTYITKEEDKHVHAVHEVRICVCNAAIHASDSFACDSFIELAKRKLISAFNPFKQ